MKPRKAKHLPVFYKLLIIDCQHLVLWQISLAGFSVRTLMRLLLLLSVGILRFSKHNRTAQINIYTKFILNIIHLLGTLPHF